MLLAIHRGSTLMFTSNISSKSDPILVNFIIVRTMRISLLIKHRVDEVYNRRTFTIANRESGILCLKKNRSQNKEHQQQQQFR